MATSIDGKIGPAHVDHFVAIGSRHDMDNLLTLRDEADGILFGASTFRAWPKVHRGKQRRSPAHHFIMSRSLELDFSAELFQDTETPVTIFHSPLEGQSVPAGPGHVEVVTLPEGPDQITHILDHIQGLGTTSLFIEGGGYILSQFVNARALAELYLTVVPTVIGDPFAPALFGGKSLTQKPKLTVLSHRQVDKEVFLHLGFTYPQSG